MQQEPTVQIDDISEPAIKIVQNIRKIAGYWKSISLEDKLKVKIKISHTLI